MLNLIFSKIRSGLHRLAACPGCFSPGGKPSGLTLIELFLVIAIIGVLSAIAVPHFLNYRTQARMTVVIKDIKEIERKIQMFASDHGGYPASLDALHGDVPEDPWGRDYQYAAVDQVPPGKLRKDKFLVPVNTDFDLYSMGPDGKSQPPFTAKASRDDIVRANNGSFVGPVSRY